MSAGGLERGKVTQDIFWKWSWWDLLIKLAVRNKGKKMSQGWLSCFHPQQQGRQCSQAFIYQNGTEQTRNSLRRERSRLLFCMLNVRPVRQTSQTIKGVAEYMNLKLGVSYSACKWYLSPWDWRGWLGGTETPVLTPPIFRGQTEEGDQQCTLRKRC